MEYMVYKVVIVEFMYQLVVDFGWQMFELFGIVMVQGDIQCQNIFDFVGMYCLIVDCCVGGGKVMEECFVVFFWCIGEEIFFGLLEVFC